MPMNREKNRALGKFLEETRALNAIKSLVAAYTGNKELQDETLLNPIIFSRAQVITDNMLAVVQPGYNPDANRVTSDRSASSFSASSFSASSLSVD